MALKRKSSAISENQSKAQFKKSKKGSDKSSLSFKKASKPSRAKEPSISSEEEEFAGFDSSENDELNNARSSSDAEEDASEKDTDEGEFDAELEQPMWTTKSTLQKSQTNSGTTIAPHSKAQKSRKTRLPMQNKEL